MNPVARANAVPKQMVNVMKLGETGLGLLGLQLVPQKDGEEFVVALVAVMARLSDLVPIIPRPIVLGEFARLKESELVEKYEADEAKEKEANADH